MLSTIVFPFLIGAAWGVAWCPFGAYMAVRGSESTVGFTTRFILWTWIPSATCAVTTTVVFRNFGWL